MQAVSFSKSDFQNMSQHSKNQIKTAIGWSFISMADKTMDKDTMMKEIKNLGILNICPSGYLSKEIVSDAIDAVKSVKLDFDKIAEEMATDLGE